jgi:hypothetical protein
VVLVLVLVLGHAGIRAARVVNRVALGDSVLPKAQVMGSLLRRRSGSP